MKLMTKEIEKRLPNLYETENIKLADKVAQVKYFNPTGIGTWYGVEYSPTERIFFGYVELHEAELGYFSLDELEEIRLPLGMKIERDLSFEPTKLGNIIERGDF